MDDRHVNGLQTEPSDTMSHDNGFGLPNGGLHRLYTTVLVLDEGCPEIVRYQAVAVVAV